MSVREKIPRNFNLPLARWSVDDDGEPYRNTEGQWCFKHDVSAIEIYVRQLEQIIDEFDKHCFKHDISKLVSYAIELEHTVCELKKKLEDISKDVTHDDRDNVLCDGCLYLSKKDKC